MQSTNVEAWTSTVEADIFQNGQIISKRMDALLGSSLGSCKGVTGHIASKEIVQLSACFVPNHHHGPAYAHLFFVNCTSYLSLFCHLPHALVCPLHSVCDW